MKTKEEIIKSRTLKVKFAAQSGIKDTVSLRKFNYPEKFYQVLEALDLVMRVWCGEPMGTSGVHELGILFSIIQTDYRLLSHMPQEAYAFFKCILNPDNDSKICDEACMGHGYMHRAYAELRTYLIDNKERVTEVYNKWYEFSNSLSEEMQNKYKLEEI